MAYISSLTVNYRKNPIGVSNNLKFSYKINSEIRGDKQISYRILVSKSIENLGKNIGETYDSGEIFSESTANIPCKKQSFSPVTKYFWKVIAKTEKEIIESKKNKTEEERIKYKALCLKIGFLVGLIGLIVFL